MRFVCLRSYLLDTRLHYDNSLTNQSTKICVMPNCDSPVVNESSVRYEESSFSEEDDLLSEILEDFRTKVMVNV